MSEDLNLNINLNDNTPPESYSEGMGVEGGSRFYQRYPHMRGGYKGASTPPPEPEDTSPPQSKAKERFYKRYPHLRPENRQEPPDEPQEAPEPSSRFYKRYPHMKPPEAQTGTAPSPPQKPYDPYTNNPNFIPEDDEAAQAAQRARVAENQRLAQEAVEKAYGGNRKTSDVLADQAGRRGTLAGRRRRRRRRWSNFFRKNPGLGRGRAAGALGGRLAGTAANVAGSAVASAVGASTGSATAATLAGGAAAAGTGVLVASGPVGLAIGALLVGSYALKEAFDTLRERIKNLSERLAQVDGNLAVAKAQREVSGIQTDIKIAQRMGAQLAEIYNIETDIKNSLTRLEAGVIKELLPLIKGGLAAISVIVRVAEFIFPILIAVNPVVLQAKIQMFLIDVFTQLFTGNMPDWAALFAKYFWANAPQNNSPTDMFGVPGMDDFLNPGSPKGKPQIPSFPKPPKPPKGKPVI